MSLQPANHLIVAVNPTPSAAKGTAGSHSPPSGVRSMTGFASASYGKVQLELRSVNSRFLDLTMKMPDRLRGLEAQLRARIQQSVKRGKLELRISVVGLDHAQPTQQLQLPQLDHLCTLLAQVAPRFPDARPFSLLELLQMPGLLSNNANEDGTNQAQEETDTILALMEQVLREFDESRQREGARLAELVVASADRMLEQVALLNADAPRLIAASQTRLSERLAKALLSSGDATPTATVPGQWSSEIAERLRQEVAALGLRADIAEELGRLSIHLVELKSLMQRHGELGKRLDFLCQELNREANTLGSKSVALELSNASMELKLLIEQVREQAQNFE